MNNKELPKKITTRVHNKVRVLLAQTFKTRRDREQSPISFREVLAHRMVNRNKRWLIGGARMLLALTVVGLCSYAQGGEGDSVSRSAARYDNSNRYAIRIPTQNAAKALTALAEQTHALFLFPYDSAESRSTNAVNGTYTLIEALHKLLKNSGLASDLSTNGVIEIYVSDNAGHKLEGNVEMNTKKNILASTIAFFVGAGGVSQGYAAENTEAEVSWLLEEVVVTATKRETSLQDTAMSISAIGGETIDKRNLVGMEDYLPFIPGVSMQDRGTGQNDIVVRGISAGDQQEGNPATGIYFGETPVTGLSNPTNFQGAGSADIKLVDIERVEVLKGPQGTLYGAGSMGGTVRIIPNRPDLSELGGKVAASFSQTGEEGGDNTMVQGVINLPLIEDQLAVRAVVYQFDNDGYIDNIANSYQSESALIAQRISEGGVAVDRKVGGQESTGYRLSAL